MSTSRRGFLRCMVGAGFPTATGLAPVAYCRAATSDPFPGKGPRGDGSVASRLVATHSAPRRIAMAPSASIFQLMSGEYPCATATGSSSALKTGRSPRSRSASIRPVVPTTRTGAPAGYRSAR